MDNSTRTRSVERLADALQACFSDAVKDGRRQTDERLDEMDVGMVRQ